MSKTNKRKQRDRFADEEHIGLGDGADGTVYRVLDEIARLDKETRSLPVLVSGERKAAVNGGKAQKRAPKPSYERVEVKCPHCGEKAHLSVGKEVYGGRPDLYEIPIFICRPCKAWVGCHPGTKKPLGTPANEETRKARSLAHATFDPLWKKGYMTRGCAYGWMRKQMGLSKEASHIAMMTKEQCYQLADMAVVLLRTLKNPKE